MTTRFSRPQKLTAALVLAVVGAGAAVVVPALAQSNTTIKVESSATISQDANGHKTVISYRNGDIDRAEVDGQEVPKDRIHRTGDRVQIVDAGGTVVYDGLVPSIAGGTTSFGPATALPPGQPVPQPQIQTWPQPGSMPIGPNTQAFPMLRKSMVGLRLVEPDATLRGHFGLKPGEATEIFAVSDGLPAAAAGLEAYDLITAIDGRSPASADMVQQTLAEKEPGSTVQFTIIHRGERKTVTITPEAYNRQKLEMAQTTSIAAAPSQMNTSAGMSPFGSSFMQMNAMDPAMMQAFRDAMQQFSTQQMQQIDPQMMQQQMEQLRQFMQQRQLPAPGPGQVPAPQPMNAPPAKPTTQA